MADYWQYPDYVALLAAVRADPESDLPRLMLADWLDDWGEADRAELIRVQCRAAELEAERITPRPADADPLTADEGFIAAVRLDYNLTALQNRAKDLLRPNCPLSDYFWGLLPGGRFGLHTIGLQTRGEWTVTRGFVDRVTCPAAAWVTNADELLAREPVARVTLTTWPQVIYVEAAGGWQIDGDPAGTILPAGYLSFAANGSVTWAFWFRWPGVDFVLSLPDPAVVLVSAGVFVNGRRLQGVRAIEVNEAARGA